MKNGNYHVMPNNKQGGWDIIKEKALRTSRHFNTQEEAVKVAREFSKRNRSELFIHGKDGAILRKDSHGNDPFPPKG